MRTACTSSGLNLMSPGGAHKSLQVVTLRDALTSNSHSPFLARAALSGSQLALTAGGGMWLANRAPYHAR